MLGLIRLMFMCCIVYILIKWMTKHYPNSPVIELFEFILGFLEGLLVVGGLGLLLLFAIGLLILL